MSTDDPQDRPVGYGNPPQHTRFKKGQSGNPSGQSKRPKDRDAILQSVLSELITVTENGKRRRITKLEALYKQLVNHAIAGNVPMVRLLFALISASPKPADPTDDPLSMDDEQARAECIRLIEQVSKRMKEYEDQDDGTGGKGQQS